MQHQRQWQQIQTAIMQRRLAHALLFIGPLPCTLDKFTWQIINLLFCKAIRRPCLRCVECNMLQSLEHPDVRWIKPEKNSTNIKIDAIRQLYDFAYLTTQRVDYKIIVIEQAEKMNVAAANALLKILEEPPPHVIFILLAQQISTMLPTIISRCQKFLFSFESLENGLAQYYWKDPTKDVIIQKSANLVDDLIAIIQDKEHPCRLAQQWAAQFELNDILWFLYLVYAQLGYTYCLFHDFNGTSVMPEEFIYFNILQLKQLAELLNPLIVFQQIDKINALLKKISHNINVNPTLALELLLEDLLFVRDFKHGRSSTANQLCI